MAGFKKLRPGVMEHPGVEDEAEVYRRRYPRKKKRGLFEGLKARIQGVLEGARPMPKWRPKREYEEESS